MTRYLFFVINLFIINFIVKFLFYRFIINEFFNLIKFRYQKIFNLIILVINLSFLSVILFLVNSFQYSATIVKNFKLLTHFFIILINNFIIINDFILIIKFRLFLNYLNHYENSIGLNLTLTNYFHLIDYL
jgi:hypothetical protein